MRLLALIFLAPVIAFNQGAVDGFFRGKNNLDLAIGAFSQNSNKYFGITTFDYNRNLVGANVYAAYGIRNDLDVIANIPFINGNFQDAGLYVKYCIPHNRFAKERRLIFIPALGVSFPMSNYNTQSAQSIGQKAIQFQPKFVFHWTTKFGLFYTAQVGYNYNLDPVPSSLSASFKAALSKGKWFYELWYDYQKGFGDVIWIGGTSQDFRTFHVTYSKIGGGVYYGTKPTYGFFLNGSYILSGVNVGNAWSVGAGFVKKFSFKKN